jgi:hypothetical protein
MCVCVCVCVCVWNLKIHNRVQRGPPLVSILSQTNLATCFRSILITSSHHTPLGTSNGISPWFSHQYLAYILFSSTHLTYHASLYPLDRIIVIIFVEEYEF